MANGKLAGVLCASVGDNEIYEAPAGIASTTVVTLSAVNNLAVQAQVFVTSGGAPTPADAISPTFEIQEQVRTYTGLVLDAGQKLFVNVDTADELAVSVNGLEGVI